MYGIMCVVQFRFKRLFLINSFRRVYRNREYIRSKNGAVFPPLLARARHCCQNFLGIVPSGSISLEDPVLNSLVFGALNIGCIYS